MMRSGSSPVAGEPAEGLDAVLRGAEQPVLIVSTKVGRGMYSIGEALLERLGACPGSRHVAIEDYLPARAVNEDLQRYKLISNHAKLLLTLVYKLPFFYWRKYLRESLVGLGDLARLRDEIASTGIKTVICVSHRPAFWLSKLKRQTGLSFALWGLLGEYGKSLGWRYLFWDQVDGFMSPVPEYQTGLSLPMHVQLVSIDLPARREYEDLAQSAPGATDVLVTCGYWGQGPFVRLVWAVRRALPRVRCHVVCGENRLARRLLESLFRDDPLLQVYGVVDGLVPLLRCSRAIITKPGISTLIEAHAAKRKIFLVPGMPVAEANNARFALQRFGAERFSAEKLRRCFEQSESRWAAGGAP
jgi:hypothetical protein